MVVNTVGEPHCLPVDPEPPLEMHSILVAYYANIWHLEKWCRTGKEMQVENGLVDTAGEGVSESLSVVSDSFRLHGL